MAGRCGGPEDSSAPGRTQCRGEVGREEPVEEAKVSSRAQFRVRRTLSKRTSEGQTDFSKKVQIFSDLLIETCFQIL